MSKKLRTFFKNLIIEALENDIKFIKDQAADVKKQTETAISNIPIAHSFLYGLPIKKGAGYHIWKGKYFTTEEEFKEYRRIIETPDEAYKLYDGEPLKTFNIK